MYLVSFSAFSTTCTTSSWLAPELKFWGVLFGVGKLFKYGKQVSKGFTSTGSSAIPTMSLPDSTAENASAWMG